MVRVKMKIYTGRKRFPPRSKHEMAEKYFYLKQQKIKSTQNTANILHHTHKLKTTQGMHTKQKNISALYDRTRGGNVFPLKQRDTTTHFQIKAPKNTKVTCKENKQSRKIFPPSLHLGRWKIFSAQIFSQL